MLQSPKKRSCPSRSCSNWVNARRQPPGEKNGSRPSITSTRARALQKVSEFMARRPSGSPRPLCAAGSMRQQPERATSSTAWRVRRGAGALHRTEEVRRRLDAYKQSFNKKSDVMVVEPTSDFFRSMQSSGSTSNAPRR